jgi:hypothetical protein
MTTKTRFAALIASIPAIVLFCVSPAFAAPKKPSVCRSYTELRGEGERFLVCRDGRRPSVWTGSYAIVALPWGERVAVGYRTPRTTAR